MKLTPSFNKAPFVGTVEPRVCSCTAPAKELFTARTAEKAIANMKGYWSVYLTFFGDQTYWLRFTITDIRDGTVIWRDGHATKEEKDSGKPEGGAADPAAEREPFIGRWILGGGPTVGG